MSVRLVFGVLLGVWLLLVLELASWIGWRLTEGDWVSYREASDRRARLAAAGPEAEGAPGGPEAPPPAPPMPEAGLRHLAGHLRGQVVHPFLGFVYTPELNRVEERGRHLVIGDNGFFAVRRSPPPSDDPLRIGIFGGSVAVLFSFHGERGMAPLLGPVVGPRGFVVESYALGGYKQPQQLMTLAWLLARGEAPDVVINLDGFNDVALPQVENLRAGINPYYPRAWEVRVRDVPDPRIRALYGEVAYLERRRAALAASFERPGLRRSMSWNFLWRWLDRRAAAAVDDVQRRLSAHRPPERPYFVRGPSYRADSHAEMVADLVALWERSSESMHELATGAGLRYYHFLQPNQYLPGSKPLSAREREIAFQPRHHYREPVERAYPELREAGRRLAARGIAFHDLTQLFAEERRTVYVDDCCHLNRLGNDLLAAAVGEVVAADLGAGERRFPSRSR